MSAAVKRALDVCEIKRLTVSISAEQVVDYIMDAVKGRQAFSVVDFDEPQQQQQLNLPEWQHILLIVCAVRRTRV